MCGKRPCAACSAKMGARKNSKTMAKRRSRAINVRNITSVAMDGLGVGIGISAGKAITNNIPQLAANPILGMVVQLAGAVVLSGMGGSFVKNVGVGMAAGAVTTGITTLAPGLASQIGISGLGAGGSFYVPGVGAGKYNNTPVVRVQ